MGLARETAYRMAYSCISSVFMLSFSAIAAIQKDNSYSPELMNEKERAVRKRAALLTVDKGEVSFNSGKTKVKVVCR